VQRQVMEQIMIPTVRGMAEEGRRYRGVLYAGLMIQNEKAKVLEFNARFGDPETQPLLLRMESDLVSVLEATIDGDLSALRMDWDERPSVCVVMAMQGYPGPYAKGKEIFGLREAGKNPGIFVFHAGTARKEEKIVTQGGRVLGVTAIGDTLADAIRLAYEAAEKISWEGVHFRKDIGQKALKREVKK